MNLKEYIKGKRKDKNAHRLELEAMTDPFLQEALDGYDLVEGDHLKILRQLEHSVNKKTRKASSGKIQLWWGVAASFLIIGFLGSIFFFQRDEKRNLPPGFSVASRSYSEPEIPEISEDRSIVVISEDSTLKEQLLMVEAENITPSRSAKPSPVPRSSYNKTKESRYLSEIKEIPEDAYIEFEVADVSSISDPVHDTISFIQREDKSSKKSVATTGSFKKDRLSFTGSMDRSEFNMENTVQDGNPLFNVTGDTLQTCYKKFHIHVKNNLIPQKDIYGKNIKGVVILQFNTNRNGKPKKIRILNGLTDKTDKEAIRLLKTGPLWPGNQTDLKITIHFS